MNRHISQKVKDAVNARSNGQCFCCGIFTKLEYSHIKAHSKGGSNTTRNLRKCCVSCNRGMGNTHMHKFILIKNLYGPGRKEALDRAKKFPGIMK